MILYIKVLSRTIPACAGEPDTRTYVVAAAADYPRVCGGTPKTTTWKEDMAGLSPRVRGNLCQLAISKTNIRTIPACAGEPQAYEARHMSTWDYPRVCGGTDRRHCLAKLARGLSPRVRGNRDQ